MFGDQISQQRSVFVQTPQQRVEPVAAGAERLGVRDEAQMAGPVADLLGHPAQVRGRFRAGDGQGRLESRTDSTPWRPTSVPVHSRRPGTLRYGVNRAPGRIERSVNLVGHHADTESAGQFGDRAQFVGGVHRPGRVVRIAQQVGDLAARSGGLAGRANASSNASKSIRPFAPSGASTTVRPSCDTNA